MGEVDQEEKSGRRLPRELAVAKWIHGTEWLVEGGGSGVGDGAVPEPGMRGTRAGKRFLAWQC